MSYESGNPWGICDRCGFKKRLSELRKEWNGLMVCKEDWEPRHPQDYLVRGRKDDQSVPNARPRQPDVFLAAGDVTADDL